MTKMKSERTLCGRRSLGCGGGDGGVVGRGFSIFLGLCAASCVLCHSKTFSSLDRFLAAAESANKSRELVVPGLVEGGTGALDGGFDFFVVATLIRGAVTAYSQIIRMIQFENN